MNDNLKIAQEDLGLAKLAIRFHDELYIRGACTHIEQAVEKALIFMAERKGTSIGKKHDIASALYNLTQQGYSFDQWFYDNASELKYWAVGIRYNFNVKVTVDVCKEAILKAEQLIAECIELERQDASKETIE